MSVPPANRDGRGRRPPTTAYLLEWRIAGATGAALGLGISPLLGGPAGVDDAVDCCLVGLLLWIHRPRGWRGRVAWISALAGLAMAAGLVIGSWRISAIDANSLVASEGSQLRVTGFVIATPKRSFGEVRVQVESDHGRVLVSAPEPVPELGIGARISADGTIEAPSDWYATLLRRAGIRSVLAADEIQLEGGSRDGVPGRLDAARRRAETALQRGMPEREAALARGFVLGQDDLVDPQTTDDFRRSGLSHLLAVSGMNVLFLVLLATPILALFGFTLRTRLVWLVAMICIYVPVAGGGASIQRAGVMGCAAIAATMAGRRSSRVFGLLAAAVVTLALNPRVSGDVGWQLSFAAVIGILLFAAGIRGAVIARVGPGRWQEAIADGVAVTVSATLSTAPLIAHHFGSLPVASLAANVLVIPAVAPAMWLGMISATLGQVPWMPVEPINALNSVLLAFISQVAEWFGRPGWATWKVELGSVVAVAAAYVVLVSATIGLLRLDRRHRAAGKGRHPSWRTFGPASIVAVAALAFALGTAGHDADSPGDGMRVTFLDVGQGDATLLQPADGEPILIDTGPPGTGVVEKLREAGVESLAALLITHDQSDHAGAIEEVLGALPVRRLIYGLPDASLREAAQEHGVGLLGLAEGSEIHSGSMRLAVLWPPSSMVDAEAQTDAGAQANPNLTSLVTLASWGSFSVLLPGDAEAEVAPVDPGPVTVLKVAHHGSDDAGLDSLLDRTMPREAVISVGPHNSYGHPTDRTIATLGEHDVEVFRTDQEGSIVVESGPRAVDPMG